MTAPNKPEGLDMKDEQINEIAAEIYGTTTTEQEMRFARALLSASKPAAPKMPYGWVGAGNYWTADELTAKQVSIRTDTPMVPVYAEPVDPSAPAQSSGAVRDRARWFVRDFSRDVGFAMSDAQTEVMLNLFLRYAAPQPSQPVEAGDERAVLEEAAALCFEMSQKYPLETMGALQEVAGIIRTRLRKGSLKVALGYVNSITPAAVALDDARAALLSDYIELNMSNYGPDDVDKLNAWAIEAYGVISSAASPQANVTQVIAIAEKFIDRAYLRDFRRKLEEVAADAQAASPQPHAQTERAISAEQMTEIAHKWMRPDNVSPEFFWGDFYDCVREILTAAHPETGEGHD